MFEKDLEEGIKIIKAVIYVFEGYKNKGYHSELKNLPIIDMMLREYFRYVGPEGELENHPEGDVFVNK